MVTRAERETFFVRLNSLTLGETEVERRVDADGDAVAKEEEDLWCSILSSALHLLSIGIDAFLDLERSLGFVRLVDYATIQFNGEIDEGHGRLDLPMHSNPT